MFHNEDKEFKQFLINIGIFAGVNYLSIVKFTLQLFIKN